MKILIRLPNWLGDVVMSTALINAIQLFYAGAQLDVIVKKELSGVAAMIPNVHKIHSFSKLEYPGLSGVFRFGKKLGFEQYDLFFCLPDSLSSAVMAWATRAKKRIGFSKEGRFFLLTNSYKKPLNVHRTDEYVYLLERFTGKLVAEKQVRLTAAEPASNEHVVVVNLNSEASSRRMPVDKGRRLIKSLTDNFKTTRFVLVGSAGEKAYIDELLSDTESSPYLENYAGKTSLASLCSLMASARAVLTTDSGPAHLSNAIGVPTIVLFGAGNELNTSPYNKEHLTVLRAGKLPCEPCVRNTCRIYGIPKCMQLLDEMEIISTLKLYLAHA